MPIINSLVKKPETIAAVVVCLYKERVSIDRFSVFFYFKFYFSIFYLDDVQLYSSVRSVNFLVLIDSSVQGKSSTFFHYVVPELYFSLPIKEID